MTGVNAFPLNLVQWGQINGARQACLAPVAMSGLRDEMRILLIQPPVQDFYQTACRTYPLGLTYLAAVLQEGGFEVAILDAHKPTLRKTIPLPRRFRYMRRYYALHNKSPYRLFSHYYHFGLEAADMEARVRRYKPHLVGVSSLFSAYSDLALDVARRVKKMDPRVITVMGGAHVWALGDQVLRSRVVDYIVRGEAEWSLLELCRKLVADRTRPDDVASIPGIGFRNGESVYCHPDYAVVENLDALPLPARNLLDADDYRIGGKRYTMIQTSRGCPHACGFCVLPTTPCSRFRHRSPDQVVAEMVRCVDQWGVRHFDLEDDNFIANSRHAETILKGIRGSGMCDVGLSAMNGISAHSLTPELAALMKETGFTHMDLALVSSDTRSRTSVGRPGSLGHFSYILSRVKMEGLRTTAHMILGMPGDKIENMMQTLLYLLGQPCFIGASIYYPVPGSALFQSQAEQIRFDEPPFWRSTLASCENFEGERDQVMTFFYLARMTNTMKHLLARYGRFEGPETVEGLMGHWYEALGLSRDREILNRASVCLTGPWHRDQLAVLMLRRSGVRGAIERVVVEKKGDGSVYRFADEFCDGALIGEFWERARSLTLKTANAISQMGR